ncbi:D-tyrosyl-tRNA(Tyr) deacylase [Lachnospiraceae bacterium A2]|nr:D-tyrosyl-tRNA(Tyr) deacylase [Lachnospiraceae bacterium A2]
MKFVIQRVTHAEVEVEQNIIGKIGTGFLVLIGISHGDTQEVADKMIRKLVNMRIFEDENGKTNLSLQDVSGELLLISQFTLYADCRKGNRPSLPKPGRQNLQRNYMNTLFQSAGSKCRLCRQVLLAPI